MSEAKKKLLELESKGQYLFHGTSISNLEELKPFQGYTIPKGEKQMVKDGEPAVSATPYAEIAIFRAIITRDRSGFEANANGALNFRASKKALEFAKNQHGYVYVLDRKDFIPRSGHPSSMEWRSDQPVKPLQMIKVDNKDLPENIKIIPPRYK